MARPVLPSVEGLFCSSNFTFRGSTTNSFWPLSVLSFCVATTWPVTRAKNMAAPFRTTGVSPVLRNGQDARCTERLAHLGDVLMGARDHMNRDDFAHAAGGFSSGVDGGADGGDVAAECYRNQAASDL